MVKGHNAAMGAADLVIIIIHLLKADGGESKGDRHRPCASPGSAVNLPSLSGYHTTETIMHEVPPNPSSDTHDNGEKTLFPLLASDDYRQK